jgi:uncharacterized protein with NRDE domain
VCLLVVASRLADDVPMVVGANRDERRDRPAQSATILRTSDPRILGGRDELAGGTWLAVNEHGVVAGLTNRPTPAGRDPNKRSRGELPLALAEHPDARSSVDDFVRRFRPADFNPCWLLVGDRRALFSLDMTGSEVQVTELAPGLHVLENNPLDADSPKAAHVRRLLAGSLDGIGSVVGGRGVSDESTGEDVASAMRAALAQHSRPESREDLPDDVDAAVLAPCVHTPDYGTRSAAIVIVPSGAERPELWVADGHPCEAPFVDRSDLWEA